MEGIVTISVKHNFETAHRLPFLGGKCTNWHGHSWQVELSIFNTSFDTGMGKDGISCDFSLVKEVVRGWIDRELDHGVMIGAQDKMLPEFIADGGKLFVFGEDGEYEKLPWPTVEAVAAMLGDKLQEQLTIVHSTLFIDVVKVQEKADNAAEWQPSMVRQKSV